MLPFCNQCCGYDPTTNVFAAADGSIQFEAADRPEKRAPRVQDARRIEEQKPAAVVPDASNLPVLNITFYDPKTRTEIVVPFHHKPLGVHIHKVETKQIGVEGNTKSVPVGGKVTQVSKNPAKQLGIQEGWQIKKIENEIVSEMPFTDVVKKLGENSTHLLDAAVLEPQIAKVATLG